MIVRIDHAARQPQGPIQRRASGIARALMWGAYLNLLWLAASAPLVTAPAAGVALIRSVRAWRDHGEQPTAAAFLRSVRECLWRSLRLAIPAVALTAWLAVDVFAVGHMGAQRRAVLTLLLAVCTATAMILSAAWWQLATTDRATLRQTLRAGVRHTARAPHRALVAAALVVAGGFAVEAAPPLILVIPVLITAGVDELFTRRLRPGSRLRTHER